MGLEGLMVINVSVPPAAGMIGWWDDWTILLGRPVGEGVELSQLGSKLEPPSCDLHSTFREAVPMQRRHDPPGSGSFNITVQKYVGTYSTDNDWISVNDGNEAVPNKVCQEPTVSAAASRSGL